MLLKAFIVHKDAMEEDKDKLPEDFRNDMVHERLEGSRNISESKWHNQILKMPKECY